MKGKRPAKSVSLGSALLKKSGPPPALPPRPGAPAGGGGGGGGGGGIGVGSLGLGPTSISGGFGSNGSSGVGGFGSNGGSSASGSSPRAAGGWGASAPTYPPAAGGVSGAGAAAGGKGKGKTAPDLAHCFELHSGKLLGDKRNREGRLYFKVCCVRYCCCPCLCRYNSGCC